MKITVEGQELADMVAAGVVKKLGGTGGKIVNASVEFAVLNTRPIAVKAIVEVELEKKRELA